MRKRCGRCSTADRIEACGPTQLMFWSKPPQATVAKRSPERAHRTGSHEPKCRRNGQPFTDGIYSRNQIHQRSFRTLPNFLHFDAYFDVVLCCGPLRCPPHARATSYTEVPILEAKSSGSLTFRHCANNFLFFSYSDGICSRALQGPVHLRSLRPASRD
jgi:hypothetical protein